jgi:hypothetical protein
MAINKPSISCSDCPNTDDSKSWMYGGDYDDQDQRFLQKNVSDQ